ncbi:hypothetical protein EN829_014835 [Mesorhizobium sp. M00.F.Ca.ET.186.01.1.1]|nr:hypothetical protein EN848_14600 [bacterium M00.F.Ca.ET.205.01.1.1]TGU52960.1 hypothetical protein EN795_14795 [bacterium M00.F.Ca.ET.152.01.1.1]TGV35930.1 hypothetical protein EN829_014835 [Mesorhizobium sp. M00.F.Ca.ET.186.01.1.1]TGZ43512.1 hypothetical protein EN805_10405 [bacterium M00.F.Ca.ET.162.01.1.1]
MPRTKKIAEAVDQPAPVVTAYKGFLDDMTCRPDGKVFQFEIGQTYRHDGPVKACKSGFHVISGHPLALFSYYAPAGLRVCQVEISGATDTDDGGEKTAAEILTIGKEVGLTQLILDAVKWVTDRARLVDGNFTAGDSEMVKNGDNGGAATASGDQGAATASGDQGAATASGDRGAATASGDWGAATASGDQGAATASGWRGAATASGTRGAATASGDRGAATASGTRGAATASGDWGAATASGYQGAATASGIGGAATASGYKGAATASGYQGAATASGDRGAATASGWRGAATASGTRGAATASGWQGAATASGYEGKARGKDGCALFLVERSTSGDIINAWAGIVGRDGVKPDQFYSLVGGKPVEVE